MGSEGERNDDDETEPEAGDEASHLTRMSRHPMTIKIGQQSSL